ncbi:MAG: damage-inducible protein DinB [Alphaproteobacteria bacterium]|nr:MAG: damage-inducible protein DinB [Alphaproteobacteria bacterium]
MAAGVVFVQNQFTMFAAYNAWANDRLYEAAAALTSEEFNRDVGAFFRSLCGTLNHILVADRIWMRRFTGEGDAPTRLDQMLFADLGALRVARHAEDRRITRYVEALAPEALLGMFTYVPVSSPEPVTQRLAPALSHFFNHQTHHRGQAHTILSILGKEPPSLDLIYFQRSDDGRRFA